MAYKVEHGILFTTALFNDDDPDLSKLGISTGRDEEDLFRCRLSAIQAWNASSKADFTTITILGGERTMVRVPIEELDLIMLKYNQKQ